MYKKSKSRFIVKRITHFSLSKRRVKFLNMEQKREGILSKNNSTKQISRSKMFIFVHMYVDWCKGGITTCFHRIIRNKTYRTLIKK